MKYFLFIEFVGVNAKIMWKKDGELVVPSSEEGVDIIDFSSTLIVNHAKVTDTGLYFKNLSYTRH